MPHLSGKVLALALLAGIAIAPTSSWAQSRPKAESMKGTEKNQTSASSDFEENRKLHERKSKENNEKKGAE